MLATQHDDGGWPASDDLASDAYATGQTLWTLHTTGLSPTDPAYQRGVRYLLETQHDDGSWKVETRAKPVQAYFDNGDPYGKHQFISTPATCWAVAALAAALTTTAAEASTAVEPYDLLIKGGTIVDGTGNPWFKGDLAIRGDRIAAVGRVDPDTPARRTIDARGWSSRPGSSTCTRIPTARCSKTATRQSKIRQGVTTEVLGEDTSGGPAKGKPAGRSVRARRQDDTSGRPSAATSTRSKAPASPPTSPATSASARCWAASWATALDRPTAAQLDEIEGAPRRGDARRRLRPLDDARRCPRAERHHRRPRRSWARSSTVTAGSTRRTSATRGPRSWPRSRRRSPSASGPASPSTSSTSRSPTSRSGAG